MNGEPYLVLRSLKRASGVTWLAAIMCILGVTALPSLPGRAESLNAGMHSASFITSDGVRLHVLEAGPRGPAAEADRAPVIAFVPGWSMPATVWRAQLAGLGASYRVVALDLPNAGEAGRLVAALGDAVTFYKVGMQLAFAGGLELVGRLVGQRKRVFLDMKLLDIDNTVYEGVKSIAAIGATFTTIHGYPNAMRAAVAGLTLSGCVSVRETVAVDTRASRATSASLAVRLPELRATLNRVPS